MQNRTRSLPVPTLGRTVQYLGYMPGQNVPVRMCGTVIEAPDDPSWNSSVTLEVVAPNGERTVIEHVSCSSTPDIPQVGSFTWPKHVPNQDVTIGGDGFVLGRADLEKGISNEGQLADRAQTRGGGSAASGHTGYNDPGTTTGQTMKEPEAPTGA